MKITEEKYIEILEIQGISYNRYSKWFTVSLDRINEAINYTRCCTELKDRQPPSFKEWKQLKLISENNKLFYLNGKSYYYEELYKVYNEWCQIHF